MPRVSCTIAPRIHDPGGDEYGASGWSARGELGEVRDRLSGDLREVAAEPQVVGVGVDHGREHTERAVQGGRPGGDLSAGPRDLEHLAPREVLVTHERGAGSGVADAVVGEVATTEDRVAVDRDSLDVAVQLVDVLLQAAVLLEQEEVAAGTGLPDVHALRVGDELQDR